jgi:hypothetical protein
MRASPMGPSLKWWSERGVQSTGVRCRVSVPMMPVRLRGDMLCERSIGIWIGLHPAWLEFDDGLTPLLLHDFKKRSKSKAVFRASMK